MIEDATQPLEPGIHITSDLNNIPEGTVLLESKNCTSMHKHFQYVQARSAHGTAYQEHRIPRADQERIVIATICTHHRSIVVSDLCLEHAAPAAGVAVVVQQPAQAIKLKPRTNKLRRPLGDGQGGSQPVELQW